MLHTTTRRAALAAGCLLALPAFLLAQQGPLEPWALVGDPANEQFRGTVHHASDGSALTFWEESAGGGPKLFAQRYRGWMAPTAPLIAVSDQPQWPALLAVDAVDGAGWVAAWDSHTTMSPSYVVRARDFNAQDLAIAAEYQVNTLPGSHWQPDVEFSADGTRAFVWLGSPDGGDENVYARVFRSDGAMPFEVKLNDDPVAGVAPPQVVRLASGDFLAVWAGRTEGGTNEEILARRFDAYGNFIGSPMQLSLAGGAPENHPRLALDATGLPVVAWMAYPDARLRRLRANGSPDGDAFDAPRDAGDAIDMIDVARDADGDIALAYVLRRDDTYAVRTVLQRFAADGTPGARQEITGSQEAVDSDPIVSSDVDGDVFVAWQSDTWSWPANDYIDKVALGHVRNSHLVDLSLSFTDNKVSVANGEMVGYVARVRHEGLPTGVPGEGDTGMFGVQITLPEHALFDHLYEMDWTCSEPTQGSPVTVDCLFDEKLLAAGAQTYPVVVYARLPSWATDVTATARVHAVRHADPDDSNDSGSDRTWIGDIQPDAFALAERTNVPRDSLQESAPFAVSGIDVPVEVSVSNGEYRIDDGDWAIEAGVLYPGSTLRVRHVASPEFSTRTRSWLYVGSRAGTFDTVTEALDNIADAYAFTDVTGVARGSLATSSLVNITGINTAVPISVSGGSFSINGGTWRTHAGYAYNGDTVRVQHTTSSSHATRTDTVLSVGAVSDTFSSTTVAADTTPDAYVFAAASNVARSTTITSAPATIGGIDAPAPIGVSGGSYSINGGAFTTAAGTVNAGDQVRLQHVSAAGFSTQVTTTVVIGGVPAAFSSTTAAADATPDAFAFAPAASVARSSTVTSGAITVAGINTAAPISVAGGGYSINGAAFTTAAGTVNAGDQVRVQHVAPAAFATATTTTLSVGGVSAGFTSTTEAADTTPNAFAFADVSAKKNKAVTSSAVTVAGINAAATVSVSGGGAKWSKNGGAFTTSPGTVVNGDVIRLQVVAPFSAGATVNVVATIGGVGDTWTVTAVN